VPHRGHCSGPRHEVSLPCGGHRPAKDLGSAEGGAELREDDTGVDLGGLPVEDSCDDTFAKELEAAPPLTGCVAGTEFNSTARRNALTGRNSRTRTCHQWSIRLGRRFVTDNTRPSAPRLRL